MIRATVTFTSIERETREVVKYKHNKFLLLTFRSEDESRQWWVVPGWPEVKPGMKVTAFLARPQAANRSNRVLGWKCHQTGEVLVDEMPALLAAGWSTLFVVAGILALHLYSVSPRLSSLTSPIPGVIFLALSAMPLARVLRSVMIRRRLNAIEVPGLPL